MPEMSLKAGTILKLPEPTVTIGFLAMGGVKFNFLTTLQTMPKYIIEILSSSLRTD